MTKSSFTGFLGHFMLPPVMKMTDLRRSLDGFQFRWLKIKGNDAAFPISITLSLNHLKATLIFYKTLYFYAVCKKCVIDQHFLNIYSTCSFTCKFNSIFNTDIIQGTFLLSALIRFGAIGHVINVLGCLYMFSRVYSCIRLGSYSQVKI